MIGASPPKGSPMFTFSKSLLMQSLPLSYLLAKVVRPAQILEWRQWASFGRSHLQEYAHSQGKNGRLLLPVYHKRPLPFFDVFVCLLLVSMSLCFSLHSFPVFLFSSLQYLLGTHIGDTAINKI